MVVSPPSVYLQYVRSKLPDNIAVAGQNCYKTEKGAYTGEIRYALLISFSHVIMVLYFIESGGGHPGISLQKLP